MKSQTSSYSSYFQTAKDPGDPHVHQIRSVTLLIEYEKQIIRQLTFDIYGMEIWYKSTLISFSSQVGTEDAGSYHCVAENVLGQAEVIFLVFG